MLQILKNLINDYFHNRALRKVIIKNRYLEGRDTGNTDFTTVYSLSKDKRTLAIINDKGRHNIVTIYRRKGLNFQYDDAISSSVRCYTSYSIGRVAISKNGDFIAISQPTHGYSGRVHLFVLKNNKWRHVCHFDSNKTGANMAFGSRLQFSTNPHNGKEELRVFSNDGIVAMISKFYENSKSKMLINEYKTSK